MLVLKFIDLYTKKGNFAVCSSKKIFLKLKPCIHIKQQLLFGKSNNRYTLNTLERLPKVGLGNGSGNEDKRTNK